MFKSFALTGDQDILIGEYSHLKDQSRGEEALFILQKVGSLVKPLLRARGWQIGLLAEFYPEEVELMGLNVNHGQKVCLRLRHQTDQAQFLPQEQVIDTLLHEMAHIIVGPHNAKFQALWDELREEYEALILKGYTGEGFLSDGHRLGGRRLPRHEAGRLARLAAEKRQSQQMYTGTGAGDDGSGGRRLGGAPMRRGQNPRKVIAKAAEKRKRIMEGCAGSKKKSQRQIRDLVDQATRNGVSTKGRVDAEEEKGVQQALWDMIKEEQRVEQSDNRFEDTPSNPIGNSGGSRTRHGVLSAAGASTPKQSGGPSRYAHISSSDPSVNSNRESSPTRRDRRPPASTSQAAESSSTTNQSPSLTNPYEPRPAPSSSTKARQLPRRPVSRLVLEAEAQQRERQDARANAPLRQSTTMTEPVTPELKAQPDAYRDPSTPPSCNEPGWTCPRCTLQNPISYLACNACAKERPAEVTRQLASELEGLGGGFGRTLGGLVGIGKGKDSLARRWRCQKCGMSMESMWWTCSGCGKMKESS